MSKTNTNIQPGICTCEFVNEVEAAGKDARRKAALNWDSPLAVGYSQVSLLLRQLCYRHIQKCIVCQEDELRNQATASLAGLGPISNFTSQVAQ